MKFTFYINQDQKKQLEFEVLSQDFYVYITRQLMHWAEESEYVEHVLIRKNSIINLSNNLLTRKIYVLQSDDNGNYEEAEYAWHESNFHLSVRRLDTIQFIEFACELFEKDILEIDFVNEALKKEAASFNFQNTSRSYEIKVFSFVELESENFEEEHINIRTLVSRMEIALENKDYTNLLHASASIFETMAKNVIGIEDIQDKTLGSFFNRYRKDSKLPEAVLDYILETYNKRNKMPLAGHGSLEIPEITMEESIILCEMTKTFVRIESQLQREI
jgi:hypothetical protein